MDEIKFSLPTRDRTHSDAPKFARWTSFDRVVQRSKWSGWTSMPLIVLAIGLFTFPEQLSLILILAAIYVGSCQRYFFRKRALESRAYWADLPDSPGMVTAWIRVMNGRHEIGIDVGQVWLDGACLRFNGNATSFVIGGQDLVKAKPPTFFQRIVWSVPVLRGQELHIHFPGWRIWIEVKPVAQTSVERLLWLEFESKLQSFKFRRPNYIGARQLPPIIPRPRDLP